MSDLDRFEIFTHVAKQGSLTRAAKTLGVSKASLSKQIKQLEQTFHVELFTRYKQRLVLTPQGEALLEQCERLTRELNSARDICTAFNAEPTGDLRVVAFSYFAQKLIFPKVKDFLDRYPKINLHIDMTERVPDFWEEQIDLAVGFSLPVPHPGDVVQKRMATTRYVLCASPEYFQEKGIPEKLSDLHDHRYIEHAVRLAYKSLKLKPGYHVFLKPYLLLNNVGAMIACSKKGIGLVQLPLYMVDELLARGELVEVLSEYQAENISVYYHYPKARYMQPKVRKFIEFFLEKEKSC